MPPTGATNATNQSTLIMATSQSGMTLSPTNQSFHSISLANQVVGPQKPPVHAHHHPQSHEKSIDAQDLDVAAQPNSAQAPYKLGAHQQFGSGSAQQCQSAQHLDRTSPSGQAPIVVVDTDSADPRAMTAHKNNARIVVGMGEDADNNEHGTIDNSDAKSEKVQSSK